MKKPDRNALIAFSIVIIIGLLVALAGSLLQTEKFFDISGSITYISLVIVAVLFSGLDERGILLSGLVVIWAIRLGMFLFHRIQKAGKDGRFDEIKPSFIRFLNAWTIQGLWVSLTAAAALVAMTSANRKELDLFAIVGFLIWCFGFAIEVIADTQKSRFGADLKNKGKFIQTGLWSRSRHPNYFGEIVLWVGAAIIALPVLHGWQWVAMISPVFVTLLLTRVSGVSMLEARADEKWSGQEEYEAYKKRTPTLNPRL